MPTAIVGIGASAGGLHAVTELLEALPPDTGMAFVIIQHLAPEHQSHLSSLLARATRMTVAEVQDEPPVEPNCVYVIPPNRTLSIVDGRFSLQDRPTGLHLPINIFFTALANTHGPHAIGVVLSGTGSDGALGIEAIKAEGGITFAQDASAQQSGMPHSAIETGCVDYVLPPRSIAAELARLAQMGDLAFGEEPVASPESIHDLLNIVRDRLNIDFSQYKENTLHRRIRRRMALRKASTVENYRGLLMGNPDELTALYQDILINVTRFFRDSDSFEALKTSIFPRLLGRETADEPIRVWVVGCSTGEEVYSLAILLLEYMETTNTRLPLLLFGTDVNGSSIERARRAWYPRTIAQDVSDSRLKRFFTESGEGYIVNKSTRELCIFAPHNVLADPPFSRMDLVSCRNLLIYFQPDLQRQLLPKLHYALKPAGVLFLGASESIGQHRELFQQQDSKHKIYAKRGVLTHLHDTFPARPSAAPDSSRSLRALGVLPRDSAADRQRTAERILLKHYAPAGVLVDEQGEILQFRGDTTPYLMLSDGKPSFNLLKLAREGLFATLRSIFERIGAGADTLRAEDIVVRNGEGLLSLSVNVIPVSYPSTAARCYWVLFEPVKQAHAEPQVPRARRAVLDDGARQISILTEELASTREHLESTIQAQEATNDDLQAANEEARSANEELQSTNEELETSKEEIQSSNEELTTVNEELRLRNTDLDRANDDLNNLFGSVQLAVVMVWPDLRIRRFTPLAQKLFNILPTDLGRSICDMNHNIQIENFPHMLSAAMDLQVDREVDVRSRDGSWYLLRIRPYRTEENTIDGATIVLIDITTLAQTQESLRNRVAELAALDRHKNEFLAILAHELRNPLAPLRNAAEVLKLSPADADVSKRARELIDRQVHHMSRLVTDLLDAARAQNGQINLQRKKLDLRAVVQRVAEVQMFQIEAKKQMLRVYLPPDPVWVDGDATRLEQVVSNLLTNANKYTDSGGHIHVTLSTSPSESDASSTSALIEVRDSGEGIDAELMPRLFNLFTQADRSLAHSQGGLGIGLSLVRTLIEMHGGKVRAHSRGRNLGSTFTVSLPLCESDRPAIPVRDFPAAELPANGGRVHRVLVVDDNADIRESTQALLSMAGHEAVVASSGEEALALASQIQPSAILLDIGLPDVSGYEVARQLRKKPQLVAVLMIAISGYDTPEARQLAIEAGFDRHLAKPVAFADLQRLLS